MTHDIWEMAEFFSQAPMQRICRIGETGSMRINGADCREVGQRVVSLLNADAAAEHVKQSRGIDGDMAMMRAAYEALRLLPRNRCLAAIEWVTKRLKEDIADADAAEAKAAGAEAKALRPLFWFREGERDCPSTSRDELVLEAPDGEGIVAIEGAVVVERAYGIAIPIANADGDLDGHDIKYFDTAREAHDFLDEMRAAETPRDER